MPIRSLHPSLTKVALTLLLGTCLLNFSATESRAQSSTSGVVTTTADSGPGSLRGAIEFANANAGTTITFNIPSSDAGFAGGVYTISPLTPLPALTAKPTVIDGNSQTTFGGDSNTKGPEILLNGTQHLTGVSGAIGLTVHAGQVTIRGLAIGGFNGSGIEISGATSSNGIVQSCYVGTNATGDAALPNGNGISVLNGARFTDIGGDDFTLRNVISGNDNGILISSTKDTHVFGNYIGSNQGVSAAVANNCGVRLVDNTGVNVIGSDDSFRNFICGNKDFGVLVEDSSGASILGNRIGVLNISFGMPNEGYGIGISGSNAVVGGTTFAEGNEIGYNGKGGVLVYGTGTGNQIRHNLFVSNGGLPINLQPNGEADGTITPNDTGDPDTGPNNLQNAPVITKALRDHTGLTVDGTLNSTPDTTYAIQIYAQETNPEFAPTAVAIAEVDVTTNGSGDATFHYTSTDEDVYNQVHGGMQMYVAALRTTAAEPTSPTGAAGDTSEFSPAFTAVDNLPTLSVSSLQVTEGTGGTNTANVVIKLSKPSVVSVYVPIQLWDDTAKKGQDYQGSSTSITLQPGTASYTLKIPIITDNRDEPDETFFVDLQYPEDDPIHATLAQARGTVTILDDDATPRLGVSSIKILEGDSGTKQAIFTVKMIGASGQRVDFNYATSNGTATANTDYHAKGGLGSINPGQTSMEIPIDIVGDTFAETDETFKLTLSNPVNATLGAAVATGTIQNDDANPSISIQSVALAEGNSGTKSMKFAVTLSAPSGQTVTVKYATANATALAGQDFTSVNDTLSFPPGAVTKNVIVPIIGDTLNETDEAFKVVLSNPVNASLTVGNAIGTIQNDDALPSLSSINRTFDEGNASASNANFTVKLSAPSGQIVTLKYATGNGTALAGSDYTAVKGTLTFQRGEVSKIISVPILGETLNEANETFNLLFSEPTRAELATPSVVGTIRNDDALPVIKATNVSILEGNSGRQNLSFPLTLSAASGRAVSVEYTTVNKTAIAGSDYVATSGTLTFAPGQTTKNVLVPIIGDTAVEGNENFQVSFSSPVNANLGTPAANGVITNDDTPALVVQAPLTLTAGNVRVTEGNTGFQKLVFRVTLSAPTDKAVIAHYATEPGSAGDGQDYLGQSGSFTIQPGATSVDIEIYVLGDKVREPDEDFRLILSGATNATISTGTAVGTIVNDDSTSGYGL